MNFIFSIKGKVERGCTLDIDTPLNEEYKTCLESGCNGENIRFSRCLSCNSDIKGNCSKVQDPLQYIQSCDHLNYPFDRRGCYTAMKGLFKCLF